MALLASGRVTKSLQRKPHGLSDPYEVPLSPLKKRSPLKKGYVAGPIRPVKTYDQKRLKAALRAGGQLEDGTLNYKQTLDGGVRSYGYGFRDRAPGMQKSLRVETPINHEVEESISRGESALDDITERARNRLICMALEGLCAAGESFSATETGAAAIKGRRRVTWEANIPSGRTTASATVGGYANVATAAESNIRNEAPNAAQNDENDTPIYEGEPLANDKEDPVPSLEPATDRSESLATVEFDDVDTSICPNTEVPLDNRISERGDRNVDVAVRPTVPYPASLFLDTATNVETENTPADHMSGGFGTEMDVEIEDSAVNYMLSESDTAVMDTEVSNNDGGTAWCGIESVQDYRMNETVQILSYHFFC
jgi:hypothetical protein